MFDLMFHSERIRYKYVFLLNGSRIFIIFFEEKGTPSYELLGWLFLVDDTSEECKDSLIDTCDLLNKLGFSIHPDKFQFISVQKIEYLGFALDSTSMTVFLTDTKQQKIKTLIYEILQSKKLKSNK